MIAIICNSPLHLHLIMNLRVIKICFELSLELRAVISSSAVYVLIVTAPAACLCLKCKMWKYVIIMYMKCRFISRNCLKHYLNLLTNNLLPYLKFMTLFCIAMHRFIILIIVFSLWKLYYEKVAEINLTETKLKLKQCATPTTGI